MKRAKGFTVIELIVVIAFLSIATVILFTQRQNLVATQRDDQRKTAINAMYYDLEEVYYAQHHSYPATLDSKTLTAMDPALLKDPSGNAIGDQKSDYRYEAMNCRDNECQSYTLRANLQKEAPYIKTSQHKS